MADAHHNWEQETFKFFVEEDKAAIQAALEIGDLTEAAPKFKKSLESLENAPLDIAITGESGSGKSTFVNAIRGIRAKDDGAAKTGVVQTTIEPTPYTYTNHPNVTIWDLPGIGTPKFKAATYLKDVQFSRYDFFIVIASERFKENHIQLALEIQRIGKKFYFVRSKVDTDLYSSKTSDPDSYNKETILKEIKDDCIKGLKDGGIDSPKVFLLSCFELALYDFRQMQDTLERELPSHKRHAFLLSLPNLSVEILQKKKEALRQQIWKLSIISAGVAAVPIPGLSVACDVAILVVAMEGYQMYFGLDKESLRKLALQVKKQESELRGLIKSPLVLQEITKELVFTALSKCASGGVMVIEYIMSTIPVFGSMLASGLSFATTYYMLHSFLNDMAGDAERVIAKALESEV